MKEKGFWEGAQAAMPTALGYVSIGLACGIIGAPYVTPVEMGLMSLFVYAGSAQFAMLALIAVQEIFGLDFALVGMFIGIFASQFQIMQRRIPVRNLLVILAVVAVSFFLLLTVVSQSLAVLFATLLGCTMGVVLDGQ